MTRRYSNQLDEPSPDAYLDDFNTGDGMPSYESRVYASVLRHEKQMREEKRAAIWARLAREAQERESGKASAEADS